MKINTIYRNQLKEKNILILFMETAIIILLDVFFFVLVKMFLLNWIYINMIFSICIFIVCHYIIGAVYLTAVEIKSLFKSSEYIGDFLLSFLINLAYVTMLIFYTEKFKVYGLAVIMGLLISYILNLKMLFFIMARLKERRLYKTQFFVVSLNSAIILFISIINLFLMVSEVNINFKDQFSNITGHIDLFYYTIITFTTIGFGDMCPIGNFAKAITIIISLTSIIYISIFLNVLFCYKKNK